MIADSSSGLVQALQWSYKLVLWIQTSTLTEMVQSYKCLWHVSKMLTYTCNWMRRVVSKSAESSSWTLYIIYLFIHHTEVVICIIVKPVLRGYLWDKEKVALKDRWPLRRFNSYEIFYVRTRKMWPFNTGDCLIEVTTWTGLSVQVL